MANWRIVISDPETRKSYQKELEEDKAIVLVGKKLGEDVNGDIFGLSGYSLKVTGGSDREGFPMHPNLPGQGKKRMLLTGPPGYHPKIKGQRKRKTVRGNTISQFITQVNVKVVKKGDKQLDEIFGKKEAPSPPTTEQK
ncbi:MAG: 30S ribosomal protein S6e [Candidatus Aenigmarchaeota archaeon]|nr:30S ribosomal protein S6e [Candidatus Aenigmarchaeota archaeon]